MRNDLTERFLREDGSAFLGRVVRMSAASGDDAFPGESARGTLVHESAARLRFQETVLRARDGSLWRVTGEELTPPEGSGLRVSQVSVVRAG